MKFWRLLPLFSLLLGTAYGQTPAPQDERAADRAALRELASHYEQAINSGDLRSLAPWVEPDASAVFAMNDEVKGIEAMQQYFETMRRRLGTNSSYTVKLAPEGTEFFGPVAIAHGQSDETAKLRSGEEYRYTTRWTAVLRKEGETWKAQRLHVSMDPIGNAFVAARLKLRTWQTLATGLFAAGIGFFVGRGKAAKKKAA